MVTPFPIGQKVGRRIEDRTSDGTVVMHGVISASREILLDWANHTYVYAVSEHYGGTGIYYHSELTDECFETASQLGH